MILFWPLKSFEVYDLFYTTNGHILINLAANIYAMHFKNQSSSTEALLLIINTSGIIK